MGMEFSINGLCLWMVVTATSHLTNPRTIVTLERAALLPGSEAQEVAQHTEEVWARETLAVDYLHEFLGPEMRDTLYPLKNGCVSLHKIHGVMHDTCNRVLTRWVAFYP
jgi:hypothetical protein